MNLFVKPLKILLNIIYHLEDVICGIGVWLTTILVFCEIINRYFLHLPIMWLSDSALYCFIFFMLIAAALTTRERGHTSVDILPSKMFAKRPKAGHIYKIFLDTISIFIVLMFLPVTKQFMLHAKKYPEYATLVRWFNTSWLRMTLFYSFILILLHLVVIFTEDITKLRAINMNNGGNRS